MYNLLIARMPLILLLWKCIFLMDSFVGPHAAFRRKWLTFLAEICRKGLQDFYWVLKVLFSCMFIFLISMVISIFWSSLYVNAAHKRTEFKLKYVCNHRSIEIYIVWFFISFTPLFPIFASAHIFGRFLSLQFQFPLGNTSSVTFHLLNICREEKKSKCAKRVQKRWQVFLLNTFNWPCYIIQIS